MCSRNTFCTIVFLAKMKDIVLKAVCLIIHAQNNINTFLFQILLLNICTRKKKLRMVSIGNKSEQGFSICNSIECIIYYMVLKVFYILIATHRYKMQDSESVLNFGSYTHIKRQDSESVLNFGSYTHMKKPGF